MQQLTLFPINVEIVSHDEIADAWQWLLDNISRRPGQPSQLCIYDLKIWGTGPQRKPLTSESPMPRILGNLYLTSQLGDLDLVLAIVNREPAQDVVLPSKNLDEDVRNVVCSQPRFRTALSEHLAFWVRLATARKAHRGESLKFACSLPNVQPEDKGPDGLFFSCGSHNRVEIQSVKNSTRHPQSLISTRQFRLYGRLSSRSRSKLLEDFYKVARENSGFTRLGRRLAELCNALDVSADQRIRMALLSGETCAYNAVVVADHGYQDVSLFEGYAHVTPNAACRVATYIGSESWREVAESARRFVCAKLTQRGLI